MKLVLMIILPVAVLGQSDVNPHNWDRRRRCDQIDYDPPCGICEVKRYLLRTDTHTTEYNTNNKYRDMEVFLQETRTMKLR